MQCALFIVPYILQLQSRTTNHPSNDETAQHFISVPSWSWTICLFYGLVNGLAVKNGVNCNLVTWDVK